MDYRGVKGVKVNRGTLFTMLTSIVRGDRPCLRRKRKGGGAVSELTRQERKVIQRDRMGRGSGYGNFSYGSCGPGCLSVRNSKVSVSSFRNKVPLTPPKSCRLFTPIIAMFLVKSIIGR
jgi:hypothetical protein